MRTIRTSKVIDILSKIPLFASMSSDELAQLIDIGQICRYEPNRVIEHDGMLAVVLSGSVAVTKSSGDKRLLMRMLGQGSVTGAASLYCDGSEPISTLTAQKTSEVLTIPQSVISEFIHMNGDFAEDYITFLTSRIRFLNRRIRAYTTGSAEAKVALQLLMSDETHTGTVDIGVSYSALADMLDIGRASLYRALDDLTAKGIISRNGRKITINDTDLLLKISEGSQV